MTSTAQHPSRASPQPQTDRTGPSTGNRPAAIFVFFLATLLLPSLFAAPEPTETFRLGFSYAMFADVNENDARASLRVLAATIARESHIAADPEPLLVSGTDAIGQAIKTARLDALALTIDEYWGVLRQDGPIFESCLLAVQQGSPTDEYTLIVRRDRDFHTLTDLGGKRLTVYTSPRLRLAYVWLEVLLARQGLAPLASYFQRVDVNPKLSKVVLDVFFRRADAALVTRQGFAAVAELNPQLGQQIVALTTSEPYVPSLFGFRTGMTPSHREHLLSEFSRLDQTPAGQQTLTIFQSGHVGQFPLSVLDNSLALLEEFARLRPTQGQRLLATIRHSPQPPWVESVP